MGKVDRGGQEGQVSKMDRWTRGRDGQDRHVYKREMWTRDKWARWTGVDKRDW